MCCLGNGVLDTGAWLTIVCAVQLTAIAPEYYETLAFHKSWTWVIWKFLSDPDVGPWTRTRRATREAPSDKAAAQARPFLLPFKLSHQCNSW